MKLPAHFAANNRPVLRTLSFAGRHAPSHSTNLDRLDLAKSVPKAGLSDYDVCLAGYHDLPAVVKLFNRAFCDQETMAAFQARHPYWKLYTVRDKVRPSEIVAIVTLEKPRKLVWHPYQMGWLANLAVNPAYQGQGLASALLQEKVIPRARQQKIEKLHLQAMPHLKCFYERLGFVVQKRAFPGSNLPKRAIEMVLDLTPPNTPGNH